MPEETTEAYWLRVVEESAENLCASVKEATAAGVPDALLLPRLMAVFQKAGMLPDLGSLDLAGLLGAFR